LFIDQRCRAGRAGAGDREPDRHRVRGSIDKALVQRSQEIEWVRVTAIGPCWSYRSPRAETGEHIGELAVTEREVIKAEIVGLYVRPFIIARRASSPASLRQRCTPPPAPLLMPDCDPRARKKLRGERRPIRRR
jgi:hypothetical protein